MNRKEKAKEDFHRIAEERGYTVVGEYVNAITKVEMICPAGHTTDIRPPNFKRGEGCKICSLGIGKAKEDFHRIAEGRNYIVTGIYGTSKTKISMICPEGHFIEVNPLSFKKGHGCRVCSLGIERAERVFREIVAKRDYTIVGEYSMSNSKIEMVCPAGHYFKQKPANFKRGDSCIVCAGTCPVKADEQFREQAAIRGYKIKGKYQGSKTKTTMVCSSGHEFSQTPNSFKQGRGCPSCSKTGYDENKTGHLYILRGEEGSVKVGITNTLERRLRELRNGTPFPFSVLSMFTGEGKDIRDCEKAFHRNFKQSGYKGFDGCTEWLQMNTLELNDFLPSLFDLKPFHYQNI